MSRNIELIDIGSIGGGFDVVQEKIRITKSHLCPNCPLHPDNLKGELRNAAKMYVDTIKDVLGKNGEVAVCLGFLGSMVGNRTIVGDRSRIEEILELGVCLQNKSLFNKYWPVQPK